jgi:LysM repeat protein
MTTSLFGARRLTRKVPSVGVGLALAAAPAVAAAPAEAHVAPTSSAGSSGGQSYVVRAGDTVSEIALRTGSTVGAIVAANGLNAQALIMVGQRLTIPAPGAERAGAPPTPAAEPAGAAPPAAPPQQATRTHTVVAGDTVWDIARSTGSTVAAIVAANGLDSSALIRIGQRLTVPPAGAAGAGATPSSPRPLVGNTFAGRTYPGTTVAAANANKATLMARPVPSREEMRGLIARIAAEMGVDPSLALAVGYQESGFDQRAVSPANAIGAMQVIPSSGEWASGLVGRPLDLLDPVDNATAGVAILRQLQRSTADLPTAIASYYQGLGSVRRNGMYADTRRYVANVQTLMTRFP